MRGQRKRWEDRERGWKIEKEMGGQRKRWEDRERDGRIEKEMGGQHHRVNRKDPEESGR